MPDAFLLDTSALIALTDEEPGAERVRELLAQAISGGAIALYGCFVSLTEVQYVKTADAGAAAAAQIMADVKTLPIAWMHSDDALCGAAADWKASHKVSFADAFVLAAAARLDAIVIHKDPEFAALGSLLRQEVLPLKTAAAPSS